MVSLRKKYAGTLAPHREPEPAAATPNPDAAKLPPVVETKPVEIEPENPVEEAARSALQDRLDEMKRAEGLQRETVQQPQPRFADEPQPPQPQMPEAIQKWLAAHPEYLQDPIAQAELNLATMKAVRGGLNWNDADFISTVERHLGLAAPPPPVGAEGRQAPQQMPMQRPQVPQNQMRQSVAVSAPPSRDSVSLTTGRPVGGPMRLTAEEASLARSLGITEQEYADNKRKMVQLKQAGVIQDGR